MSIKLPEKVVKAIVIVTIGICIISWYLYLSRPVSLNEIININTIKEFHILTYTSRTIKDKLPQDLKLNIEQDINAITNILDKYKYSKIVKYYNPRVAPSRSADGAMNIFINLENAEGEFKQQYIYLDTNNDVVIQNKKRINIEYKISGSDNVLFEDLANWLRQKQ